MCCSSEVVSVYDWRKLWLSAFHLCTGLPVSLPRLDIGIKIMLVHTPAGWYPNSRPPSPAPSLSPLGKSWHHCVSDYKPARKWVHILNLTTTPTS